MKKLLFCLCLISSFSWAQTADTYKLNDLINTAVQQKDFTRARSLAVTQEQFDYVRLSEAESKRPRPRGTGGAGANCYASFGVVVCN